MTRFRKWCMRPWLSRFELLGLVVCIDVMGRNFWLGLGLYVCVFIVATTHEGDTDAQ